jgi:hypothetical protein
MVHKQLDWHLEQCGDGWVLEGQAQVPQIQTACVIAFVCS